MVRPNGAYAPTGQVKFSTPILLSPGQVAFPINVPYLAFTPDTVIVNNQTAATIQVGPSQGGPYQTIRQYSYQPISWQYAPSLYVQQLGSAALAPNDFLEVDVRSSPFGAPSASSYTPVFSAPAGWAGGPLTLPNVKPGDAFFHNQVANVYTVYNTQIFGVKADGVTDDTTAWRNALNAAKGTPGGRVLFPGGTSIISGTLTVPHGVVVQGLNASGIIKATSNFVGTMVALGDAANANAVRLENLTLDGNGVASTCVSSDVLNELSGLWRVICQNYTTYGFYAIQDGGGGSYNFAILDSYFLPNRQTSGAYGIFLDNSTPGSAFALALLVRNTCNPYQGAQPMTAGVSVRGFQVEVADLHVENGLDGVFFDTAGMGRVSGLTCTRATVNNCAHINNGSTTNWPVVIENVQTTVGGANAVKDDVNGVTIPAAKIARYVAGGDEAQSLTLVGHVGVALAGRSSPGVAAGANLGNGSVAIRAGSTDEAGEVNVTGGTTTVAGELAILTFAAAYAATPLITLELLDVVGAAVPAGDTVTATTRVAGGFRVSATTAPGNGVTHVYAYRTIRI